MAVVVNPGLDRSVIHALFCQYIDDDMYVSSRDMRVDLLGKTKTFLIHYQGNGFASAQALAREMYEVMKVEAVLKEKRLRSTCKQFSYECPDEPISDALKRMETEIFNVVVDMAIVSLEERFKTMGEKIGVLVNFPKMTNEELVQQCETLSITLSNDEQSDIDGKQLVLEIRSFPDLPSSNMTTMEILQCFRLLPVRGHHSGPTGHGMNLSLKLLDVDRKSDESAYREEAQWLTAWCKANNLSLNVEKTKEMLVDFRRAQSDHSPLNIDKSNMEILKSTKFLGVHLAEDFTWSLNTSSITKKAQQHLCFLRRLRKAHLPPPILTTFYRGTIESILSSCITAWFGNCTVSDPQRIVRTAEKLIGVSLPSITDIYSIRYIRKANSIFTLLSSGKSTNFIPDRSRPGLTTTAIGTVDLQGAGGNWATVGRRSRGGRRVHRQREKRKGKSVGLRIGTLNVGTMTGKGRELADMMERRKVDILCVQETRWKGSKARSIGAGFKLFYYGVDSKRNGVGVVLKEEFVRNVLEVKRVSDRVMSLKLEIEGVMLNVVSGYAPQVGCELEEKEKFWSELDEVMESIPTGERVVIGADFNGHVGEGNTGDEEVMGKFGVKERNLEGQMVVDFAKRMHMAVVNTYFQKREEHRVTYKSGGR
ncbi:hypothetical protein QTP70_001701 [Hemibagrus guttatus]|uniref:Endonuclease/exonuclease/phosphatase domain-containing protein n=1 Tax=Hemibagrus guttatus TaxID=175788 RepID=A0AAE0UIZ0_9TELE|nr:hypothetical protein QTP70_001701 [Hemibagrus guttatus]